MSAVTILAKNGANKRLDKFLSEYLIELSRTIVNKMISDGMVYVDGEKAKPSLILKGTEKISYTILDREKKLKNIEPEDIDLEILFEDDAIIAINKALKYGVDFAKDEINELSPNLTCIQDHHQKNRRFQCCRPLHQALVLLLFLVIR